MKEAWNYLKQRAKRSKKSKGQKLVSISDEKLSYPISVRYYKSQFTSSFRMSGQFKQAHAHYEADEDSEYVTDSGKQNISIPGGRNQTIVQPSSDFF